MDKLHDSINRFCAKHPYWGIPNLMRYIVIATVAAYALGLVTNGVATLYMYLSPEAILHGEVWRLVTLVFLPSASGPISLLLFLYFYYWIGTILENYWGTPKFTLYYISGVVLTIIGAFVAYLLPGGYSYISGLHYVNMAMFLAYAALAPDAIIYFMFFLPVKIKWLAWADLAYFAFEVLVQVGQHNWGSALAPIVALLNFVVFFWPYLCRKARVERAGRSKQATRFRQTVKASQQPKSYNHKCAVCGRTDAEYPNLSFRYCSRCAGYHCFCEDHIFNHVHFTEEDDKRS